MDKDKLNMLVTGEVSVVLNEDEISSLAYAIGGLKSQLKEIKNDDAWKNEVLKTISNLESIKEKYMSAKYD